MRIVKWLIICTVLVVATRSPLTAGGLYPLEDGDSFAIENFTITYGIDSASQTITAQITQSYWGSTDQFLWIIPVPDDPNPQAELDFEPLVTPNTPVVFDPPPNYCAGLYRQIYSTGDGYYDPDIGYPQSETAHVLRSDNVLDWLTNSEYDIPDMTLEAVENYAQQGLTFVIVEMSQLENGTHGAISISLKYHSDRLLLPLAILQAERATFELQVNILADTRYIPLNFAEVAYDIAQLRIPSLTSWSISQDDVPYFTDRSNFQELGRNNLIEVHSRGFITELAAPTELLVAELYDDSPHEGFYLQTNAEEKERIAATLNKYSYLTRFYGYVQFESRRGLLPDAEFIPAPEAPIVSNIVDANSPEPLALWECSTRTIPNNYEELLAFLPTGRSLAGSYLSLPIHQIALPEGWQQYDFDYANRRITVFAPEAVDETTFSAYLSGEPTPPMLLIRYSGDYIPNTCAPYNELEVPSDVNQPIYFRCIANLWPRVGTFSGTVIGILTSQADFAENEPMYRAMVDFPFTYQYMLHPQLRHTLLLSPIDDPISDPMIGMFFPPMAIGYPEGWLEQMPEDQHLLIMPVTFSDMETAPYVRGYPVRDIAEPAEWDDLPFQERKNSVTDWLVTHFGVDKESFFEAYTASCGLSTPLVNYAQNGRQGYVAYIIDQYKQEQPFIIEISAPDSLYDDYQRDIENMREAIITLFGCG